MHRITLSLAVCLLMLGSSVPSAQPYPSPRSVKGLDLTGESLNISGRLIKQLAAPIQISPADGVVFYHNPRTMTLAWKPVAGAGSYAVQVQFCAPEPYGCGASGYAKDILVQKGIGTTSHTFNFVGGQPGRWRVWAADINREAGLQSGWWGFKFVS